MSDLEPLRIVSLLPSATEILDAIGAMPFIVGRSHECDYPPEIQDRPVCTAARLQIGKPSAQIDADVQTLLRSALSIYDINLDVLRQLRPTHIVTQDQCDVCAVSFSEVQKAVAALDGEPQIISLQPNTLKEVWADIDRVATCLGISATPVLTQLQHRVTACQQKTHLSAAERPSVVTIEWIDPLMTSGNWIPELVELAGGRNLLGTAGEHSPYLSWETLLAADPDVVVVMPCGFDLARTEQEMQQAFQAEARWQQLRASLDRSPIGVARGIYLTDGNAYFNRPGPRLVDSLEILTEILHPHSSAAYQEVGWKRWSANRSTVQ